MSGETETDDTYDPHRAASLPRKQETMNYFENQKAFEEKGVDYDLSACLEYNPQSFTVLDIEKVLAVWEGERDEEDWRWVIKVNKQCADKNGGRFVFLQGGCDYTGWDCQSSADSKFAKTANQAAKFSTSGMRWNNEKDEEVYKSLANQLKSKKSKTWREDKDVELNTKDIPKIQSSPSLRAVMMRAAAYCRYIGAGYKTECG